MSKIVTITVLDLGTQELETKIKVVSTPEMPEDLDLFINEHVGGRPNDRA